MRPPEELLYDSEASLRLVDHAIEELGSAGAVMDEETRALFEHLMIQPGVAEPSRSLLRVCAESLGIAQRISERSGMVTGEGLDDLQQKLTHVATLIADIRLRLTEIAAAMPTAAVAEENALVPSERKTA